MIDIDATELDELELDYLRYFYGAADFGPAHDDVIAMLNAEYDGQVPEGY